MAINRAAKTPQKNDMREEAKNRAWWAGLGANNMGIIMGMTLEEKKQLHEDRRVRSLREYRQRLREAYKMRNGVGP